MARTSGYNCRVDEAPAGNDIAVQDYISALNDEQLKSDSELLIELMQRISGHAPKLWNVGTLGFDTYHYKYDTKREGYGHILGFYPRKGKVTLYLMDGTARYADQLSRLGKHTKTGYCVYFKQLADVDLTILEEILRLSYSNIKALSEAGPINRILWRNR